MTALKSNKIFPNVCRKIKTRRIKIYPDDDKKFYFQLFIHTLHTTQAIESNVDKIGAT